MRFVSGWVWVILDRAKTTPRTCVRTCIRTCIRHCVRVRTCVRTYTRIPPNSYLHYSAVHLKGTLL